MTRRRIIAIAVITGVGLGGVAAALATGADPNTAAPSATPTPAPIRLGPPRRPADRLPDGRYSGEYPHFLVNRASLALAPRTADPGGGPGWAVRTFKGERRSIRGDQPTLTHPVYRQRMRCAELVRTYRGQVGWVFADRRFQSTTPGAPSTLSECGSLKRPEPIALMRTVLAFPDPASPVAERAAVFGLAPPGTRTITLTGAGAPRRLALARDGGFLDLLDGGTRDDRLVVEFALANGRTDKLPLVRKPEESFPGLPARETLTPIPGSEHAEARAPDPAGGPGWAVPVLDTRQGAKCVGQPGQVVGDRIGWVDTTYGLFTPAHPTGLECLDRSEAMTDAHPCLLGWGGGGPDDPLAEKADPLLRRAHTQRRISGGRFQITVTCRDDVDRVTIRTPRDLRTLVPSARGHVVFALYDGTFPSGEIVATYHRRDGSTRTERFDASL